eukprot:855757_1
MNEYNARATIKSGMRSSQSKFSKPNDRIIENIFSFLNVLSQAALKKTCHPLRNIIQQSDTCAQVILAPYVEQTRAVDFKDVCQLLPMYSIKCYNQMVLYCDSALFQTYCRMISYHWHLIWTYRGRKLQKGLTFLYIRTSISLYRHKRTNL